ncbi:hypothetical protein Tco_0549453 [Tanacetum coccineum]
MVCDNFEKRHKLQYKTVQGLSSRVFTLELQDLPHKIDQPVNEAVKEAVHTTLQALLRERFRDLSKADMKEILHDRMFKSCTYRSHPKHIALYKALEASMDRNNRDEFLEATAKSPQMPLDWKTVDTRDVPLSSSKQTTASQFGQPVEDVPIPDDVHFSDTEDTDAAHLLKIKPRPDWLKPVLEEERPETPEPDWVVPPNDLPEPENKWANAFSISYKDPKENRLLQKTGDMSSFIKWYCQQIGKSKLSKADSEGPTYKIDLVNSKGHRVVPDVRKPLPLGGPPGQVTIQTQFFFNKDLEYLMSGIKERMSALSISKLKAANYPDFRLEELVPSLWIVLTSHILILSVVSLKTISRYGYTYLKEIVLCRADYNEYKISKSDFKNLHPNDFKDLYLLHLQGKLNHLSGSDKVNLFNADASDFLFKEDYTIVSKPRAVIYRDRYDQKKMMRETEKHKFSDGALTRILDKLDHMVKDFKLFKYNPGMETRIWSEDDKRRSKEFMEVIEGRLKIKRIFKSLESFVSERLRDVDY